jgi:hypothetical protein
MNKKRVIIVEYEGEFYLYDPDGTPIHNPVTSFETAQDIAKSKGYQVADVLIRS